MTIPIRCIIFDLDGTLVDSFPGIHQSVNDMLRGLHLPEVDLQTTKHRVGRGLENLVRETAGEANLKKGIKLFRKSYETAHLTGTHLFPDVHEVLQRLKEFGIRMAVASNKPADFSKSILRHLEIDMYFEECLGPDSDIPPKPHPAMLHEIMRRLDSLPGQTLYVGDMMMDVETARNAGVPVALVASGAFSEEELKKAQPEFLFGEIGELLPNFVGDRKSSRSNG